MDELKDLLEEVAADITFNREVKPFNQPSLITVSSVNQVSNNVDEISGTGSAFSSFTVNLPRPALDVKSLQLLSTNIPQCNQNIPNTACAFWYYRLSQYSGFTPSINNLYYVRLLPTTYKDEYMYNPTIYGRNKTFNNYSMVNTELAKSCARDLLFDNIEGYNEFFPEDPPTEYVPFLPNDVSITFDPASNKFQMTGLNTQVAYKEYDPTTRYEIGDILVSANGDRAYANIKQSILVPPPNGNNFTTLSSWTTGVIYVFASVVVADNNVVYQCIQNGASTTQQPYLETTHWAILGTYNRPETYSPWNSGTNYNIGQVVEYNSVAYVLTLNGESTTIPPPLNPTHWTAMPNRITRLTFWRRKYIEIVNAWSSTASYSAGVFVSYNNQVYQAILANKNVIPGTDPARWTAKTFPNWYSYLITGYDDPNVKQLQGELFNLQWNTLRQYNKNDIVQYNGQTLRAEYPSKGSLPEVNAPEWTSTLTYIKGAYVYYASGSFTRIYRALQTNQNVSPTNTSFWTAVGFYDAWVPVAQGPLQTGLFGLTNTYDMVEFVGNTGVLINFPYGVGGQPYNPNPKRLLNSILGFTWNGEFNPSDFANIEPETIPILTSKKFPLLYNHLRPIPQYLTQITPSTTPTDLQLGNDVAPSVALTYTADSYANLVYSSVISIYANVVGASSLDTQKASSLLAITSMNCGNLGVAFWSNYVENPLVKVNGDLYTIQIEFRDEFGEPYPLSNNAVATLTFKVGY